MEAHVEAASRSKKAKLVWVSSHHDQMRLPDNSCLAGKKYLVRVSHLNRHIGKDIMNRCASRLVVEGLWTRR